MSIILPELTPLVLNYLSREDIYELMITCKHFYTLLSSTYYCKIVLGPTDHKKFLQLTDETRVDGNKIGDYVKELEIHKGRPSNDHYLGSEEFHRLVKNLPYLQKLVMVNKRAYERYLEHLKTIPVSDLKEIQEISMSRDSAHLRKTVNGHIAVNHRFMDKIKSLHYYHIPHFDGELDIIDSLPGFKNLAHLYIYKLGRPIELSTILSGCLGLSTFESICVFTWKTLPNPTNVYKNLTSLNLGLNDFTAQHINYFMQAYPNLKKVDLTLRRDCFLSALSALSSADAKNFSDYLNRMDQVAVQNTCIHARSISRNVAIRNLALTDFMHHMCPQDTHCNAFLHLSPLPLNIKHFILQKQKGIVNISAPWTMNNITDDFWASLKFLTLDTLVVNTTHTEDMQGTLHFIIDPLLEFITGKQPCPIFVKNFRRRLIFCAKSSSMPYITSDVPALRRYYLDNKQPPIDYGYVKRMTLSNDRLQSLGKLYPDIELLVLKNCKFEAKEERSKDYHIDVTHFKNIGSLWFDFDAILSKRFSRQPIYILFSRVIAPYDVYCYRSRERRGEFFIQQYDFQESDIPPSAYVFRFSYTRVSQFAFKRNSSITRVPGREVPS